MNVNVSGRNNDDDNNENGDDDDDFMVEDWVNKRVIKRVLLFVYFNGIENLS